MADDPRRDTRLKVSGAGDDSLARRPFQFTLRTLLLLTFIVAIFCSAAVTFHGMTRVLAFTVLLWAVAGGLCWRRRVAGSTVVAHLAGPTYASVLWIASACEGSVWGREAATFFAVGFFASTLLTIALVCLRRRW